MRDETGRALLAQRQKDHIFSGLWEFPGGKSLSEETAESALRRELAEELGIVATRFELLVSLDHDYPDRLVHLDFFLVPEWEGEVRAMDGQELRWLLPAEIDTREILAADIGVVKLLRDL